MEATQQEQIAPCVKCKHGGQSIVRVEGRCEACFIEDFINPIKKELRNAEEIIQHLHDAEYVQLQRLGVARKVQLGVAPRSTYHCTKGCGYVAPLGAMFQLIWHEEHCTATKKEKKRSDSGQRKLKVNGRPKADVDDEKVVI